MVNKLLPKKELQQRLLMFYLHLSHIEKCVAEVACFDAALAISDAFKDITKSISEDRLSITAPLVPLLPPLLTVEEFQQQVAGLKQQLTTADKVQECHAELVQTREQLLNAFREHQSHCDSTNICPTCGHPWPTAEALFKGIENQSKSLENVAAQQNNQLSQALASFRRNWQEPIELALQSCLDQNKEIIEYKRQLASLTEEQIHWLQNYYQQLQMAGIGIQELLCENFELVTQQTTDELERQVRERFKPIDDSCIFDDYERIYREVFKNDPQAVEQVTPQRLELKKVYLGQLLAVASSKFILQCEQEYNKANLLFKKATVFKEHLCKLKKIYEEEKRLYLESIVKEIEILFHIYSGRLMQSYQQGLGIFIENDGNSIAFNETPGQEHDAVFSMSSGQLSALVLSFTLALNQRYAKHSLLLVDDPVQTLDEINVAGFVELLRSEFRDRQIIMSTHEDRMSAYFRYKYKKFGMAAGRINFMEEARSDMNG
ncbi:hypothetical protein [Franconibacter pulveris]|uniref:hypothetical protein n=1 Tax=Franconibacter pulveris TaxID=435910 RepID=UPI00128F1964|nr:hypothetical protein [Franconibacter pulveris]